jgi:hypothetical protein
MIQAFVLLPLSHRQPLCLMRLQQPPPLAMSIGAATSEATPAADLHRILLAGAFLKAAHPSLSQMASKLLEHMITMTTSLGDKKPSSGPSGWSPLRPQLVLSFSLGSLRQPESPIMAVSMALLAFSTVHIWK